MVPCFLDSGRDANHSKFWSWALTGTWRFASFRVSLQRSHRRQGRRFGDLPVPMDLGLPRTGGKRVARQRTARIQRTRAADRRQAGGARPRVSAQLSRRCASGARPRPVRFCGMCCETRTQSRRISRRNRRSRTITVRTFIVTSIVFRPRPSLPSCDGSAPPEASRIARDRNVRGGVRSTCGDVPTRGA